MTREERTKTPRFSAEQARNRWAREDSLINQRTNWHLVVQGLLFTAYANAHQSADKIPDWGRDSFKNFVNVLPGAGVLVALCVFAGILSAGVAIFCIWRDSELSAQGFWYFGIRWYTTLGGWLSAIGLPIVFIFVWLSVANTSLRKFLIDTTASIWKLLW